MKNTNRRPRKNIFKKCGGGVLLSLCNISLIGVGFSSWVISSDNNASANINIEVGDVVEGLSISDIGFSIGTIQKNIDTVILKKTSSDGTSSLSYSYQNRTFESQIKLDISNRNYLNVVNFDDEVYCCLKITLSVTNLTVTNGLISGVSFFPTDYSNYSYDAFPSKEYGGVFYIPIKSVKYPSFYTTSSMDILRSLIGNSIVPTTISFTFSENSLPNTDSFITASHVAKVTYSIASKADFDSDADKG